MPPRSVLAALLVAGCLLPNPAYDRAAGESASDGATGPPTTDAVDPTAGSSLSGPAGTSDVLTDGVTGTTTIASDPDATTTASSDPDATTDAPPPPGPILCGAPFDLARLQPAVPVSELNSGSYELDMWLTADGLTIYFSSGRDSPPGDTYRATRPAVGLPFGPVTSNTDLNLNTGDGEFKLALTADGLRAALSVAGAEARIYAADRPAAFAPFGPRTLIPLQFPGATGFVDPHLTGDGARLYAAALVGGTQDLAGWHLRAADPVALDPDPFAEINALPARVADPSLSSDELLVVFLYHPDGQPDADLWYATRDAPDGVFTAAAPFAPLNTGDDDVSPHLSADGCEIFFARGPTTEYVLDIHRAAIAP